MSMVAKLQAVKVGGQKKAETFWVRGYVFRKIAIVDLVFGRPAFESRSLQTLRAHNFEAFGPASPKTTFFETPDLFLLAFLKKLSFEYF